jgi:phage baseplate assembly protein V
MPLELRFGIVDQVDEAALTVRVVYGDRDDLPSPDLHVGQRWSTGNQGRDMPDIGEQVACLVDTDAETGIVIDGIVSTVDTAVSTTPGKWVRKFKDGATLSYNRDAHALTIDLAGGHATITGGVTVTGDLDVSGHVHASGDVTGSQVSAGLITLTGHKHPTAGIGAPSTPIP